MTSGIIDGQPVDATNSNPAWLAANGDDEALGKIGLNDQDVSTVSGPNVTNSQRQFNSIVSFVGMALNGLKNLVPTWTSDEGFTAFQTLFARLDAVGIKFKTTGGHAHNPATAGDGAAIQASYLAGVKLRALIQQGVNIIGATGVSSDISTQFALKNPSSSVAVKGVVTNTPYNMAVIRQASGVNQGDSIFDSFGNLVYGRITFSAGVWTLSFYVLISGTETAYSFASATDIGFYYQEIFNQLTEGPVYDPALFIPSDNTTADVIDASATQSGKVNTLAQTFAGLKTFLAGIDVSTQKILNVLSPTALTDAANKNYVDTSGGFVFLPTSAGTTNILATGQQRFVPFGTSTHTYLMPDGTTIPSGMTFACVNASTQNVVVKNFNSTQTLGTVPPNCQLLGVFSPILGAQSWQSQLMPLYNFSDSSLNMLSAKIKNLATPTALTDAANKTYVDAFGGTSFVATAGGTTVFTVASPRDFIPFGTLAENYQLPSTSLLQVGNWWRCVNRSTQSVTIKNSTGGTIAVVPAQIVAHIRVTATGSESFAVYFSPIYSSVDGSLSFNSAKGVLLADPTAMNDAANKGTVVAMGGAATSAGAGGTTTLIETDDKAQRITGTLGQTFILPSTANLKVGATYWIENNGTAGSVVVQDSAASTLLTLPINTIGIFKVLSIGAQTWWSQAINTTSASTGGGGTLKVSARAYKTSDTTYPTLESNLMNSSNWAKSDPQNIITLSSSRFTIPNTFTGTVRVKVTTLLGITSVNTFTNWRKLNPIVRRITPSALLVGIGTDITDASIVSGQPASGTSGSPFFQGTSSFEANPNDVFAVSFYTTQSVTTDSQGFQNWCLIEIEQM